MCKENRRHTVQAAEKTVELLEILATGSERLSIGGVATRLEASRKDALLLLVALESRGIVRWDERARIYRPGQKSAELARQILGLFGLSCVEPKAPVASRPLTTLPVTTRKSKSDRRFDAGGFAAGAS
jgi:hypothetical protein